MFDYTITENNLHLINSYQIWKSFFKAVLQDIQKEHPDSNVWKKGLFEMQMEWTVHNFCYMIHFKRERTKDCDLNYPQKWYIKAAYILGGIATYLFIK